MIVAGMTSQAAIAKFLMDSDEVLLCTEDWNLVTNYGEKKPQEWYM